MLMFRWAVIEAAPYHKGHGGPTGTEWKFMAVLADELLAFWFGPLNDLGLPQEDRNKLWFTASDETDRICRERFGTAVSAAIAGELDHWAQDDNGLVALVLLLDQLTRNIHRGTPAAFSGDERALAIVREAAAGGRVQSLPRIHQVFLYLPYEHSEDLAAQGEGQALFDALLADSGNDPAIASFHRFMAAHRQVIEKFGRFPHRNAILGRESTPAELAHLKQHGGF